MHRVLIPSSPSSGYSAVHRKFLLRLLHLVAGGAGAEILILLLFIHSFAFLNFSTLLDRSLPPSTMDNKQTLPVHVHGVSLRSLFYTITTTEMKPFSFSTQVGSFTFTFATAAAFLYLFLSSIVCWIAQRILLLRPILRYAKEFLTIILRIRSRDEHVPIQT